MLRQIGYCFRKLHFIAKNWIPIFVLCHILVMDIQYPQNIGCRNWGASQGLEELQFWLFQVTRLKNSQIQFTAESITPLLIKHSPI